MINNTLFNIGTLLIVYLDWFVTSGSFDPVREVSLQTQAIYIYIFFLTVLFLFSVCSFPDSLIQHTDYTTLYYTILYYNVIYYNTI